MLLLKRSIDLDFFCEASADSSRVTMSKSEKSKSSKPHSALPTKSTTEAKSANAGQTPHPAPAAAPAQAGPPAHGAGGADLANEATAAVAQAGAVLLHYLDQLLELTKGDSGFSMALMGAAVTIVGLNLYKKM